MGDQQSMVPKSPHVQEAIFAVLEECRRFFKAVKYKNHCPQAQLCADELRDFILAGENSKQSLPNYWSEILGKAIYVHNTGGMIANPTYSNSLRLFHQDHPRWSMFLHTVNIHVQQWT